MTDHPAYRVDPADEGRHHPDQQPLWNESVYLDFVADDGAIAGYARIGLYPNLGVTWWTTVILGRDRPLVTSVAYDLPVGDGTGLVLGAGGIDMAAVVERPLATVSLRGTAEAAAHTDPAAVYRHEAGEPTRIGLDLTWATDGTPYRYEVTTRYEIPCLVTGSVTVGEERIEVVGQGQRDHSWGERDWWAFEWCWSSARLDDGTRVHLTHIRLPSLQLGVGYVQRGGVVDPLTDGRVVEELGAEGFPRTAIATYEPSGLAVIIEPIAFGPVILESPDGKVCRFPRAMARFTAEDGRSGLGWVEWGQPQPT